MPLGLSFQPGTMEDRRSASGTGGANPSAPSPVQEAIQLLSLRLPTQANAQALAPQPLLQSSGGAGLGMPLMDAPNAEALKKLLRLLGIGGPSAGNQAPSMPNAGDGGFWQGPPPGDTYEPVPPPAPSKPSPPPRVVPGGTGPGSGDFAIEGPPEGGSAPPAPTSPYRDTIAGKYEPGNVWGQDYQNVL